MLMLGRNCHGEKNTEKRIIVKRPWTKGEIKEVLNHFQRCLAESQLSGKVDAAMLLKLHRV